MVCCNDQSRCCSVWRIVQSAIGIFVGLSSGSIFLWQYGNYQASAWAFTSALFSLAGLHLAILLHKRTIGNWYTIFQLKKIQLLAFILTDIAIAIFFWYIFYAAYYHIPMMPVDQSAIVTSVWVFMSAKWTMILWFFARRGVYDLETYTSLNDDV